MRSQRGQAYAESGLMTGYLRDKKESYKKQTNPHGEVSFILADINKFMMNDELLNYINTHVSPSRHLWFKPY